MHRVTITGAIRRVILLLYEKCKECVWKRLHFRDRQICLLTDLLPLQKEDVISDLGEWYVDKIHKVR